MSESRKQLRNIFWPKIESAQQAQSLVNIAAGLCVFICGISLVVSLLYKYELVNVPAFQSAWMSIFIYGPLAYFIHEKEKIAAWTALGYYVMDQIYMLTQNQGAPGVMMILIACAFISNIRALNYLGKQPETPNQGHQPSKNNAA